MLLEALGAFVGIYIFALLIFGVGALIVAIVISKRNKK
jgi:hypothetical protein